MLQLIMSEKQRSNLMEFMRRVDMKGDEALAWFELYQIMASAKTLMEELPKKPRPETPAE